MSYYYLLTCSMSYYYALFMFMTLSDHKIMITSPHHGSIVMAVIKAGVILVVTVIAVSSVQSNNSCHLRLYVFLLDTMHPIEMTVQTVLTCILFTALRTDHVRVLVLEMNIFNVTLQ